MAHDSRGYYKLLNTEPGADIDEVQLNYGFLKYEWEKDGRTPDRKIEEAYACLSDPGRKAAYDARRGKTAASSRQRMTGYLVLLVILFVFAAFIFPGFLKPAPVPYQSGDRLASSANGSFLGEVVRREQFHDFPNGKASAGYLIRTPGGEERWYPAADLERHFHKQ